ncbi:hypothetical protein [Paenimyroides aestuarii]|uniref:Lipoprotein n=1 Tax=Paenimyroides aestuarii TaxID=2968490 RepID=A0ABY5NUP4_9FLAO|nr:hypothetical protein [Paenimyroides aestuarii]UUV22311.1 hypothetical protein NPX36_04550 [Paenimyroides aestuarii]
MKNLIIIIILSLLSCQNNAQTKTEAKPEIKAISISIFGGRSTIQSRTYVITKDSVLYDLVTHHRAQNIKKSYPNKAQDWENLLKSIDLEKFKNAKNGSSYQETDGYDTEITITTTKEKIIKLNGEKSESWSKAYRQLISIYFKEEKK